MLAAAAGSGLGLVPVFYIVSIIGVVAGGAFGLYRWQKSQRQQWLDEGVQAQKQNDALTANTEAARRNTEAISTLTGELRGFMTDTRAQLSEHARKIDRLEARRQRRASPPAKELPMSQLVETKVTASTIGAGAAGVVLWALQAFVFKGHALNPGLITLVDLAVPAVAAGLSGYFAPHTPRPAPAMPAPAPPPVLPPAPPATPPLPPA